MEVRWRADIDHIDIWPIARFRKTAGDLWNPVLFRYGRSALAETLTFARRPLRTSQLAEVRP